MKKLQLLAMILLLPLVFAEYNTIAELNTVQQGTLPIPENVPYTATAAQTGSVGVQTVGYTNDQSQLGTVGTNVVSYTNYNESYGTVGVQAIQGTSTAEETSIPPSVTNISTQFNPDTNELTIEFDVQDNQVNYVYLFVYYLKDNNVTIIENGTKVQSTYHYKKTVTVDANPDFVVISALGANIYSNLGLMKLELPKLLFNANLITASTETPHPVFEITGSAVYAIDVPESSGKVYIIATKAGSVTVVVKTK